MIPSYSCPTRANMLTRQAAMTRVGGGGVRQIRREWRGEGPIVGEWRGEGPIFGEWCGEGRIFGRPTHENSFLDLKMWGMRKCMRLQSSMRLFWRGVPVSRSLRALLKVRRVCHRMLLKFLMLCASSKMR